MDSKKADTPSANICLYRAIELSPIVETGWVVQDKKAINLNAVAPIADRALGLAAVLRQSILKKACTGQLVGQDPNDEPASVPLERIKAEKAAQAKGVKAARKPNTRYATL